MVRNQVFRVQEALVRYILDQPILPGKSLPAERKLAIELKSSRNTVREALRMLQSRGIIEVRQGSGCYVKKRPGEDTVENSDLFQNTAKIPPMQTWELMAFQLAGRKLLVPQMALQALQHMSEGSLEKLEEAIVKLSQAILDRDFQQVATEDSRFHFILAETGRNPLYLPMFLPLKFQPEVLSDLMMKLSDQEIQRIFKGYVGILKAFRRGDESNLEEQVKEMLAAMALLAEKVPEQAVEKLLLTENPIGDF